jgi:hypothetical protein
MRRKDLPALVFILSMMAATALGSGWQTIGGTSRHDGRGDVQATFDTLGPLPPGTWGFGLYFAYALNNPWDFASNPVAVHIVP